jgi:hypothetical protein
MRVEAMLIGGSRAGEVVIVDERCRVLYMPPAPGEALAVKPQSVVVNKACEIEAYYHSIINDRYNSHIVFIFSGADPIAELLKAYRKG